MQLPAIRLIQFVRAAAALLLAALSQVSSNAQSVETTTSGVLAGTVSNQATKKTLEGALIELPKLGRSVLTGENGQFIINNLPSGELDLVITYSGLDPLRKTIDVKSSGATVEAFELTADVYRLEKFTVAGEREGNAASITKRKNADNVGNVLSMDSFGNVADGNIGNFLLNIPGVTASRDWGDVTGVGIRGTPPELNSVTIDGARASSSSSGSSSFLGDRAVQIDQIPSEFVKEVEVTKGNKADQWADSLGGSINLITKSAFDYKTRVVTYRVGGNLNTYRDSNHRWGPTAALTYLDTFGAKRQFGIAITPTYNVSYNTFDRVQMERRDADNRMSTARDFSDESTRIRSGLGTKLEYRPDPSLQLGVSANYSYYKLDRPRRIFQVTATGNRGIADYSKVSRAAIEAGTVPRDSANVAAGIAPGFTDTFTEMLNAGFTNQVESYVDHSQQLKFGVFGKKTWADSTLSFKASYNPTEFNQLINRIIATSADGIGMSVDTSSDPQQPVYRQTYGPTIFAGADLSKYTATLSTLTPHTEEEIDEESVDYEKSFRPGLWSIQFKTGLALRRQHRRSQDYSPQWRLVGADGVAGVNSVTKLVDDNVGQFVGTEPAYANFNGFYQSHDLINVSRMVKLFQESPSFFAPVGTTLTVPAPGEITETVSAGYVMGRATRGPFTVVAGVRLERTAISASGSNSDPLNPSQKVTTREGDYEKFFPSIHLRYALSPQFILRGSWSTSSARPAVNALIPNTSVTYDGGGSGTITQNNPGLKPQTASNYDFSAEYYSRTGGELSAGVFHKDIKDFITSITANVPAGADNGFGGSYADFDLLTKGNIGKAKVDGVELNLSQQLRMLPSPFNGLSVWANYTQLRTSGTYANGASELVDFIPKTYNGGLSYKWRGFQTRLAYHYASSFLRSYNVNPVSQQYLGVVKTADVQMQYTWRNGVTAFFDYTNIFNNWTNYYSYRVDPNRIRIVDNNGPRLTVGISGRF